MAGIAGFTVAGQKLPRPEDILDRMVQTLVHTGREVIQKKAEPSFLAASVWHPQDTNKVGTNEDGSIVFLLDGHAYVEPGTIHQLRQGGHALLAEPTDADVCVHLYEERGSAFAESLDGSFAFALYDGRSGSLILGVDRFSSRLLFWAASPEGIVFASGLDGVAEYPSVRKRVNLSAMADFLLFEQVSGTKTGYEGVETLPPAHMLEWKRGPVTLSGYWEPSFKQDAHRSLDDYADEFAFLLRNSVRRITSRPLNYGILLSGGLDSRLILGLAEKPLTAYTLCDWENDEVRLARSIAGACGAEHVFLKRSPDHYVRDIEDAAKATHGMFNYLDEHVLSLAGEMDTRGTQGVLHGNFMDSFFKGYYFLSRPRLGAWLGLPARLPGTLPELYRRSPAHLILLRSDEAHSILSPKLCREVESVSRGFWTHDFPYACAVRRTGDLACEWYAISKCPGRCRSMGVSSGPRRTFVEFSPLWDNHLFDFHFRLPEHVKRLGTALVVRTLQRSVPRLARIPDGNTGVPPSLVRFGLPWQALIGRPYRLLHAEKNGRGPHPVCARGPWQNYAEALRLVPRYHEVFEELRASEGVFSEELFQAEKVFGLWKRHCQGDGDLSSLLFRLLSVYFWCKTTGL